MAEKRGLFTPKKISKKRIAKIKRDPIAAVKLIGSDPGLFAQELVRGSHTGKFLYGFPHAMDKDGNPFSLRQQEDRPRISRRGKPRK